MRSIPEWIAAGETASNPSSSDHTQSLHNKSAKDLSGNLAVQDDEESKYDSEDDTDIEFTAKCIEMATEAYAKCDYNAAVKFLQLAQPQFYHHLQTSINDIKLMLAKSRLELGNTVESRTLCECLVACKITCDQDRITILDAAYILSQGHLLEGNFDDAQTRCRQVITGRKRLDPTSNTHLPAIALMAAIFSAKGELTESEVWKAMLPKTFVSPASKMPAILEEVLPMTAKRTPARSGSSSTRAAPAEAMVRMDRDLDMNKHPVPLSYEAAKELMHDMLHDNWGRLDACHDDIEIDFTKFWAQLSPFFRALVRNDQSVLDGEVDLQATETSEEMTALHLAILCRHQSLVVALLQRRADIEYPSRSGSRPLHAAVECSTPEIVERLLKRGVRVDVMVGNGDSPLHLAARRRDVSVADKLRIMTLLLDYGASIDVIDSDDWTALHIVTENCETKIVQFLIDRGANVVFCKSVDDWTPLEIALDGASEAQDPEERAESKEIVRILRAAGAY
jgi:ankyrin repeat protein